MAKITFLGDPSNVASTTWGQYTLTINQPVEINDPHIIAKARRNRFFHVEGAEMGAVENEDEPDPVTATDEDGKAIDAEILEPDEAGPVVGSGDEVLAMADTEPFMTFRAEAAKILGEDMPAKKADIIAALRDI